MRKVTVIILSICLLSLTHNAQASTNSTTNVSNNVAVKKMQASLKLSKERYLSSAARDNLRMLKDKKNSLAYQQAARSLGALALQAELISSKLTTKNIAASRKLEISMHLKALAIYKDLSSKVNK